MKKHPLARGLGTGGRGFIEAAGPARRGAIIQIGYEGDGLSPSAYQVEDGLPKIGGRGLSLEGKKREGVRDHYGIQQKADYRLLG